MVHLKSESRGTEEVLIPLERVAKFVRQLSHDLRNSFGAIDLQAAFLSELVSDPEVIAELRKMRGMVSTGAKSLQTLSAKFAAANPNLVALPAKMFMEDFQDRLARTHAEEAAQLKWSIHLEEESIAVDLEMLFTALAELCRNAFHFRRGGEPILGSAQSEDGHLVVELRQPVAAPETAPETWGRTPLVTTRRGGYGLGLYQARHLLAAHRGTVDFVHDPTAALLTTRVVLPLADPSE